MKEKIKRFFTTWKTGLQRFAALLRKIPFWVWAAFFVLLLECTVFQYPYWRTALSPHAPVDFGVDRLTYEYALLDDNPERLLINANSVVELKGLNCEVVSLRLFTEHVDPIYRYTIAVSDEAYQNGYRTLAQNLSQSDLAHSQVVGVHSNGKVRAIKITFDNPPPGFALTGIQLNARAPFAFDFIRVIGLFGLAMVAFLCRKHRVSGIVFDHKNRTHNLLYAGAVGLLVAFCLFTGLSSISGWQWQEHRALTIPAAEKAKDYGDIYHQQLDAFIKGQLHLDLPVDDQLDALVNPYDPTVRSQTSTSYFYDRAYYNGKYQNNYGLSPVLLSYYPFYLLTGKILSTEAAGLFFGVIFCLLFSYALKELLKAFSLRANLLVVLLSPMAGVAVTSALWCVRVSTFYEIGALCALCSFALFWWCSLRGTNGGKPIWFSGAAIGLGFLADVQPVLLLACLPAIFFYWRYFAMKQSAPYRRIWSLVAFALPLLLGIVLVGLANAARFSSPFDPGYAYTLTQYDTSYNNLTNPYNIIPTVYHFLLQIPTIDTVFPFIRTSGMGQVFYQNYYFCWPTVGLLGFPLCWLIFITPYLNRRQPQRIVRHFSVTALTLGIVGCFVTFSLFGVIIRYTAFVFPIFAMLALLCAWQLTGQTQEESGGAVAVPPTGKVRFPVTCALLCVTILIGVLLSFSGQFDHLQMDSPVTFMRLRSLFAWWL